MGLIVPRVMVTWQSDRVPFTLHHFSIPAKGIFHAARIRSGEEFLRAVLGNSAAGFRRPQGPLPRSGISYLLGFLSLPPPVDLIEI